MNITVPVNERRVADLLCCAFEGGSGYWLKIIGYRKPSVVAKPWGNDYTPDYISYPLSDDGAVVLWDQEEGGVKRLRLDRAAIERGMALFSEKAPRHFGDWLAENDDAETGDVFIQLCLLGDIVYG